MIQFCKEVFWAWRRCDPGTSGAALAFYALFSFPTFVIVILGVASTLINRGMIEMKVMQELQSFIGPQAAETIRLVATQIEQSHTGLIGIIGAITIIIGSIGAFGQIQVYLNRLWKVPASTTRGIWFYIREKIAAFTMVFFVGVLLMISLGISSFSTLFYSTLEQVVPEVIHIIDITNALISFTLLTIIFMFIFAFLPDVKISRQAMVYGGIITTFLFLLGKAVIESYLSLDFVTSAYGAASSIIVILLWSYYSAQIFLLGAACTYTIDQQLKRG